MIAAKKTKTGGGSRKPYKQDVFARFINWQTLTTKERKKAGIITAGDFAKKYGIHEATLSKWKNRPDYHDTKRQAQIHKLSDSTADVLDGLKTRCIKYGMANDVELFLLYVEKWDRKHVLEILGEIKLGKDDIRSIVDVLPEDRRKQFYVTLSDLIAEAKAITINSGA